jgi:hypothetical protein
MKVADLGEPGLVFSWESYPWMYSDVRLGPTKLRDKKGAIYAMVDVLVRPADLPGVYHRRNMSRDVEIHLPVMISHPDPMFYVWRFPDDLGEVTLPYRGIKQVDVEHYAVCPRCETLHPCDPANHAEAARRRQMHELHLSQNPPCQKCGHETHGGMSIEFGDPPDRVAFHGKRGPCENAAYRYAADNGWTLPPKDEPRDERSWTIRGERAEVAS